MNINEILQHLDGLYHESRLSEAETYMNAMVAQALQEEDKQTELSLQNELIGFYRDAGRNPEAVAAGRRAMELLRDLGLSDTKDYATTLVNVANALRAAGNYPASEAFFGQARACYDRILPKGDGLFASLDNNLSLLYQAQGRFDDAIEAQRRALQNVEDNFQKTGEDLYLVRTAISKTNLAVSLNQMKAYEEARGLLLDALKIFTGRTPSDFHYSAALAGLADICYEEKNYEKAADLYEMALSEIELHMGRNNFFEIVSDNLKMTYEALGTRIEEARNISGLELCERYFKAFGEAVLQANFPAYYDRMSIGLLGEGSECFGYDDEISRDHDFGPGFSIWLDEDTYQEIGDQLALAYNRMPKTYMGYTRLEMKEASGRIGVSTDKAFFERLLGIDHVPETNAEWLAVPESGLAAATNGRIFWAGGSFVRERMRLLTGYPDGVWSRCLAQQLALMAQSGQYNYPRMLHRKDPVAASLYRSEFVKATLSTIHLLEGRFTPYEKWAYRSACSFRRWDQVTELLREFILAPLELKEDIPERISKKVIAVLKEMGYVASGELPEEETYLTAYAELIAKKGMGFSQKEALIEQIVLDEWEAFDKVQNEGGRAGCQDDWETFSIMRKSQYLTWPMELLTSYLQDFEAAKMRGWNLITEKYGRMMESTTPERYKEIEPQMPVRSEDYLAIREAIIKIQVGWMEDLSERYPLFCGNARAIHTYEDKLWRTSYETYLRGELTTYSEETLQKYGRFVAGLAQKGENLAQKILWETARLYGYHSIEEAEKKLQEEQG